MHFSVTVSSLLSALLTGAVALLDFSQDLGVVGSLGLKLDYPLALRSGSQMPLQQSEDDIRNLVASSHLVFKDGTVSVSDGQLLQIGCDAVAEKIAEFKRYGLKKNLQSPYVSVLAIGKEIFISTPFRGDRGWTYTFPNSPVRWKLLLCQILARSLARGDSGHGFDGLCGEVMVAHQYFRLHDDQVTMAGLGGRIVTAGSTQNKGCFVVEPCDKGPKGGWGCDVFTVEMGWSVVPMGTAPQAYSLAALAGGLDYNDQISVCR